MKAPRSKLWRYILGPIFVLLTFLGLFALIIQIGVNGDWFWLARPPVPADARNTQTFFPSTGGQRDITFETAQTAENVTQYYQKKLTEQGWQYLCSPTGGPENGCPFWRSPGAESADIYVKNDPWRDHTMAVEVFSSGVREVPVGHHLVEITETLRPEGD